MKTKVQYLVVGLHQEPKVILVLNLYYKFECGWTMN